MISPKILPYFQQGLYLLNFQTTVPAQCLRLLPTPCIFLFPRLKVLSRQVRRMFEHFGYRIHNLKRIAYAGLTLGGVKRGGSRQLTIREVKALKALGAGKE